MQWLFVHIYLTVLFLYIPASFSLIICLIFAVLLLLTLRTSVNYTESVGTFSCPFVSQGVMTGHESHVWFGTDFFSPSSGWASGVISAPWGWVFLLLASPKNLLQTRWLCNLHHRFTTFIIVLSLFSLLCSLSTRLQYSWGRHMALHDPELDKQKRMNGWVDGL